MFLIVLQFRDSVRLSAQVSRTCWLPVETENLQTSGGTNILMIQVRVGKIIFDARIVELLLVFLVLLSFFLELLVG